MINKQKVSFWNQIQPLIVIAYIIAIIIGQIFLTAGAVSKFGNLVFFGLGLSGLGFIAMLAELKLLVRTGPAQIWTGLNYFGWERIRWILFHLTIMVGLSPVRVFVFRDNEAAFTLVLLLAMANLLLLRKTLVWTGRFRSAGYMFSVVKQAVELNLN